MYNLVPLGILNCSMSNKGKKTVFKEVLEQLVSFRNEKTCI